MRRQKRDLAGHTNDPSGHLSGEIQVANSVLHALQHMLLVEQSVSVLTTGWRDFLGCQASATQYVQKSVLRFDQLTSHKYMKHSGDGARFSSVQHARPQEEFDGQPWRQSQQAHSDAT